MTATANHWFNLGSNRNYAYFLEAQWEGKGLRVGMSVTSGQFPAGTVVTQIIDYNSYYFVRFNNRHTGISGGQAVDFALGGDLTGTNFLYMDQATWEASGAVWTPERAYKLYEQILHEFSEPTIDQEVDEELKDFVARRKTEGGAPTDF